MTVEIPMELLTSLASPVRQAVNPHRSLCNSPQFIGSWLWDAELDSGVKHGKGETAQSKAIRHEAAKAVCRACPERDTCLAAAKSDPDADGVYGGQLFTKAKEVKRGRNGQSPGGARLRAEGSVPTTGH